MKFKNISLMEHNIQGSHYQGKVGSSFKRLVEIFGQPYRIPQEDQDKYQVEWVIKWEDGTISTIYDWKWDDTDLDDIPEWNIGGYQFEAALYVHELVNPPHMYSN